MNKVKYCLYKTNLRICCVTCRCLIARIKGIKVRTRHRASEKNEVCDKVRAWGALLAEQNCKVCQAKEGTS